MSAMFNGSCQAIVVEHLLQAGSNIDKCHGGREWELLSANTGII